MITLIFKIPYICKATESFLESCFNGYYKYRVDLIYLFMSAVIIEIYGNVVNYNIEISITFRSNEKEVLKDKVL